MGAADKSEAKGGAAIGILMLETRFPRLPGDIGNPASFDFPVLYATVAGADPETIAVRGDARSLLPDFIAAAHRPGASSAQGAAGRPRKPPFQCAADACGACCRISSPIADTGRCSASLPAQAGGSAGLTAELGLGHSRRRGRAGRYAAPASFRAVAGPGQPFQRGLCRHAPRCRILLHARGDLCAAARRLSFQTRRMPWPWPPRR